MNLVARVLAYYANRQLLTPTTDEALMWLTTEVGEATELWLRAKIDRPWVRNNPKPPPSVEMFVEELGDVIMMAVVAAASVGEDPIEILLRKMERKEREHAVQKREAEALSLEETPIYRPQVGS